MFNRIALALIVLIAVPYYWLLMERGPTSAPMLPIDLARLRARGGGENPGSASASRRICCGCKPARPSGPCSVAGGGLTTEETGVFVWRLVTPGGDTPSSTPD